MGRALQRAAHAHVVPRALGACVMGAGFSPSAELGAPLGAPGLCRFALGEHGHNRAVCVSGPGIEAPLRERSAETEPGYLGRVPRPAQLALWPWGALAGLCLHAHREMHALPVVVPLSARGGGSPALHTPEPALVGGCVCTHVRVCVSSMVAVQSPNFGASVPEVGAVGGDLTPDPAGPLFFPDTGRGCAVSLCSCVPSVGGASGSVHRCGFPPGLCCGCRSPVSFPWLQA